MILDALAQEDRVSGNGGPLAPSGDDPGPVELFNPDGRAAVLLVCDHASAFIPRELANLGLDEAELSRHIAWDIGAADLTRALASRLDAPAVLGGFSRLIIDPNRYLDHESSILKLSDGVAVPGNRGLDRAQRERREAGFFRPYHAALSGALAGLLRREPAPAVVSIHSFTPMLQGVRRPWEVGVLWDQDPLLPVSLIQRLSAAGIVTGDNEPYNARDGIGYTLAAHADSQGLAQALIEVRQDLIDTRHGILAWSDRLGDNLGDLLGSMGLLAERER